MRLLALLALAAVACATTPDGTPRCSESAKPTCLAGMDCTPDRDRGCMVCVCRPWDETKPREGSAANAYPEGDRPGAPPPRR